VGEGEWVCWLAGLIRRRHVARLLGGRLFESPPMSKRRQHNRSAPFWPPRTRGGGGGDAIVSVCATKIDLAHFCLDSGEVLGMFLVHRTNAARLRPASGAVFLAISRLPRLH